MTPERYRFFWSEAAPQWFVGIATFILALVAIFQEWIRKHVVRPRLEMSVRVARPDCHKTRWNNGAAVYYFRLRVENVGNDAAHDVGVYLAGIERLRADKTYEIVDSFDPMNLLWSYTRVPTLPTLLPSMPPRFCDLAHITVPAGKNLIGEDIPEVNIHCPVLALDLEATTNRKGHLLKEGTYKLRLKLAASNHPPSDYTLEVYFQGLWADDEDTMLREGFGMRLL